MAWRDIDAIPVAHWRALEQLHDSGVFGFITDTRREYRMMEGFNAVVNAVVMTSGNKKNKPIKMPPFNKVFPTVDKMIRRGVSSAALKMAGMAGRFGKRDA